MEGTQHQRYDTGRTARATRENIISTGSKILWRGAAINRHGMHKQEARLGERTIRTQPDMMKEGKISYRFSDKTLLDEEGRGRG